MRASTLPGPTSTKAGAPASCRASTVSRQRTGRDQGASASSSRTSSNGAALAPEKTGKRGLARSRPRRARRGTAPRPAPSRASGTRRRRRGGMRAASALARRPPRPRRARRAAPDRTTWPGALSLATVTPACLGDRLARPRASRRRGRASSRCVGLGHQAAAQDDELERVVARRARRRRRARRARRASGRRPAHGCRSERVPAGDRGAEDRGLCEAGVSLRRAAKGSSPTSSVTRSSSSGGACATRSRMSGVWLPWPGNSRAMSVRVVIGLHPERCFARVPASAHSTPRAGGYAPRGGG